MRVVAPPWQVFACAAAAGLAILGMPASPAAAAHATAPAARASQPGIDHFNVGATHSPQLLQALAAPQGQTALAYPAASTATGTVQAGTAVAAGAAGAVQGIDVASSQHPSGAAIGWAQVAGAGYQFAAVKATEATYYTNPYYASDLPAAKAAGLSVMAYSFANPWSGDPGNGTAVQQADYLVSQATVAGSVPPLMLDIEYNPYLSQEPNGNVCYSLTPSAMVTWISHFIAEVHSRTGQLPILYTTANWWSTCTSNSTAFGDDPMWVAQYTTAASPLLPVGWGNWALWQYTSVGAVPGITGNTDLDALNLFNPGTQQDQVSQPVPALPVSQSNTAFKPALQYTASGLPNGLSIDSADDVSGTPTSTGVSNAAIAAATANGVTGSVRFTWYIHGTVTVTSPGNQSTVAGNPVYLQMVAADSVAGQTLSYSVTGLPAGMRMNSHGLITGWAPQTAGTRAVTVTATDGLKGSGSASFSWTVTAAPGTGPAGHVRLDLAGKCLDDAGNSSANGTKIQIWSCIAGDSAQHWTVVQDQTLRIHGKCLSVAGSSTAAHSKVVLETCSGAASQQWREATAAQLFNPVSALCLTDPGGSTTNGTQVEINTCIGAVAQKWTLPAGPVVSQIPGKCMDDAGNSTTYGNPIDLQPCSGGAAQNWTAKPDGTVRIHGMCLDVYRSGTASGTVLDLYGCNGTVAQQWKVLTDRAGIELQNPHAGLCLADPGDTTTNGTRLVIGACSTADPGVAWRIR